MITILTYDGDQGKCAKAYVMTSDDEDFIALRPLAYQRGAKPKFVVKNAEDIDIDKLSDDSDFDDKSLKDIAVEFANETTLHGVPKIIKDRSCGTRLFWSCVCLSALCMFLIQASTLMGKYLDYKKKVDIEVLDDPAPFPSISLCNIRHIDAILFEEIQGYSQQHYMKVLEVMEASKNPNYVRNKTVEEDKPFYWTSLETSINVQGYLSTKPELVKELGFDNINDLTEIMFTRETPAANIDKDKVTQFGIEAIEFIITCVYSGDRCNYSDFKRFFHPFFYNCFTFNTSSFLTDNSTTGRSFSLIAFLGKMFSKESTKLDRGDTFGDPVYNSDGLRIVIHSSNSEPDPIQDGFNIPAGFSASIGVKATQYERIDYPYGNCSEQGSLSMDNGIYDYTLISCQNLCLQNEIIEHCQCIDIALPIPENVNVSFCQDIENPPIFDCLEDKANEWKCNDAIRRSWNKFKCMRSVKGRVSITQLAKQKCRCYPPCHEITYGVFHSLTSWPSMDQTIPTMEKVITGDFMQRFTTDHERNLVWENYFPNYSNDTDLVKLYLETDNLTVQHDLTKVCARFLKDFSHVYVYIADDNVVKITESEFYSGVQLVSDIGGQLGLWVGISVVTLAELLQLCATLCGFLCKNKHRRKLKKEFERRSMRKKQRGASVRTKRYNHHHHRPRSRSLSNTRQNGTPTRNHLLKNQNHHVNV
ncbi:unnamed protein product [Owenia fusiformis]|uniref:Uncharacterized protein n=1 Tax=Owenia fusiformis TaxID=6347 RepID=A0A8S4PV93_OWEFU|nr:unnamed protein product [Owenia fusiformis]